MGASVIRYGKGQIAQIRASAKLYVERSARMYFVCEISTNQARMQKAIRKMARKLKPTDLRSVSVLSPAQEAWLRGIELEAFSLENAAKLYANREKK